MTPAHPRKNAGSGERGNEGRGVRGERPFQLSNLIDGHSLSPRPFQTLTYDVEASFWRWRARDETPPVRVGDPGDFDVMTDLQC